MADHTMVQGDSLALDFSIVDGAGAAVSLAGATIGWAMARSANDVAILQKSIGSGIEVTDAAGGEFTVSIVPEDTADLSGAYYFEAEVTDSLGNVSTVRTGTIRIKPGLIT